MKHFVKKLNFSQIININFGILGILFGWELEIANVSGIYTFFGANESHLGYLWLAPSVIGLIIPILIGYLSDRTVSSYGKRLPYIFWGAIITSVCMILLPNAPSLTLAVILLCTFTATINMALQPFKPLVADLVPAKQLTTVYAIQAALIGIGATLASLSPYLLLVFFKNKTAHAGHLPSEIKFSFYIGAITLLLSCSWTTFKTKHYLSHGEKKIDSYNKKSSLSNYLRNILTLFSDIPKVMWEVSVVQFFTWLGAFCFIVYLTPAIEQAIYHIPAGIHHFHALSYQAILEKSVVLNGIACAVYMAVNTIYAYCIPWLANILTRKIVHFISLTIGGLSMIALFFIHGKTYFLLSMIGVGIAWASFNSIPFAIIASAIPQKKLGIYMGLFNVSICLPQIIVSLVIGLIFNFLFHKNAVYLIILSGISMIFAAILTLFVKDKAISERL